MKRGLLGKAFPISSPRGFSTELAAIGSGRQSRRHNETTWHAPRAPRCPHVAKDEPLRRWRRRWTGSSPAASARHTVFRFHLAEHWVQTYNSLWLTRPNVHLPCLALSMMTLFRRGSGYEHMVRWSSASAEATSGFSCRKMCFESCSIFTIVFKSRSRLPLEIPTLSGQWCLRSWTLQICWI